MHRHQPCIPVASSSHLHHLVRRLILLFRQVRSLPFPTSLQQPIRHAKKDYPQPPGEPTTEALLPADKLADSRWLNR